MKKTYQIAGMILVLLIIGGILAYNLIQQSSSSNQIAQKCSNQSGYCIYTDIPAGMLYTDPAENIPENLSLDRQATMNLYFKRTNSQTPEINEAFGLDSNKYICANGNKIIIVNYFYNLCEGYERMAGCGYNRKAIICGNIYFIEQYSDATGPILYGPFNL